MAHQQNRAVRILMIRCPCFCSRNDRSGQLVSQQPARAVQGSWSSCLLRAAPKVQRPGAYLPGKIAKLAQLARGSGRSRRATRPNLRRRSKPPRPHDLAACCDRWTKIALINLSFLTWLCNGIPAGTFLFRRIGHIRCRESQSHRKGYRPFWQIPPV